MHSSQECIIILEIPVPFVKTINIVYENVEIYNAE